MAARAYWKGQIRLALVSIPVEIYSATKSGAAVTFRQIHEPSGKPIKYEKVVPGIGAIDHDEIVKGFELSKGNYVLLDEEEIEAVKLESKRTLELVQFVDTDAIDVLYYTKPYYVVPADDLAEEAYIVLREALQTHQESRARPAGAARAGTACRAAAVRARARARGAALRRRGEQGGQLFPRRRQCQARRRPARPRRDADRQEIGRVRRVRLSQSLYRRVEARDRQEGESQGQARTGRCRRTRRHRPRIERHRPDGGAESLGRRQEEAARQAKHRPRKRAKKAPTKKAPARKRA